MARAVWFKARRVEPVDRIDGRGGPFGPRRDEHPFGFRLARDDHELASISEAHEGLLRVTVAEEGSAFAADFSALPQVLIEFSARSGVVELAEQAWWSDGFELAVVADEGDGDVVGGCPFQDGGHVGRGDHGGFVDDEVIHAW
jgi:hypothetical protein